MRTDSCRKCGKKLSVMKTCNTCENAYVFECKDCNFQTDLQIHRNCVLA